VLDLIGALKVSLFDAATAAERSVSQHLDIDQARRLLSECEEQFRRINERVNSELGSHDVLAELDRLARDRGGQWRHWVKAARPGIDNCIESLQTIRNVLTVCWQELTERAGTVSIWTTAVGKQVINNVTEAKTMVGEGTT